MDNPFFMFYKTSHRFHFIGNQMISGERLIDIESPLYQVWRKCYLWKGICIP